MSNPRTPKYSAKRLLSTLPRLSESCNPSKEDLWRARVSLADAMRMNPLNLRVASMRMPFEVSQRVFIVDVSRLVTA